MKSKLKLTSMAGLLLAVFLLSGCGKQSANSLIPDSPYKVIDTGYWNSYRNSSAEPLWLDNDRLLFPSTDKLVPGPEPYRLMIYNTATGKVTASPLMVGTNIGMQVCARDGKVVYEKPVRLNDPKSPWLTYRGTLEDMKEHPAPNPDMHLDEFYDCDWVPGKTFGFLRHNGQKSKLRGENYHEMLEKSAGDTNHQWEYTDNSTGQKGQFIYHQNANSPSVVMPFTWPTYSEYLDAYVSAGYYDPKELKTSHFSILQRNGDLKQVTYPKNMLVGSVDVYPVKPGYLLDYNSGPFSSTNSGDRGLYLMQGNQVQRLIIGTHSQIVISPDGCKAAFSHASTVNQNLSRIKPYRTIKYINFCQGVQP